MDRIQIAQTIRRILEKDPRIVLVYVFGSVTRGESGPLSDIDVGVLLAGDSDRRKAQGDLMDSLCRALRTDRVDLVLVDDSPITLVYRIIRDGKLIHSKDERARERFETATILRYLDLKPLRDMAFRTAREAVLGAE
jgi:predicted nucleotidyltransferase